MLRASLRLINFITSKERTAQSQFVGRVDQVFKGTVLNYQFSQTRAASTCTMGVKVHIIYWPKFTKLKTLLEDEFPGELEITGESTPTTTGWFEVEVNGKLVHSKKRGEGFVDSEQKMAVVVGAIEKALGH
ncbi:hypothetical protein MATL_G00042890 [Megalops atlanticus]|uniref:Selenoprotein W n=1 Tax=Megalops atlanticus TaxID=7932 RepID=A0A9D3TEE2_MEGAT|nr:hypothetical protein MATL_G00042890 [Megalops atlanticus]